MNEYLPPVVTKLKADLSDLVKSLAEARVLIKEFAHGVDDDLRTSLHRTVTMTGEGFTTQIRQHFNDEVGKVAHEAGQKFEDESKNAFDNAGKKASGSFTDAFSGMLMPALIGLGVLLSPWAAGLIAGALSLGFGLAFVGIGAYVLRAQKPIIDAFGNLKKAVHDTFFGAAQSMLGPLVEAMGILAKATRDAAPAFKEIFAAIAPGIAPLAKGIAEMLTAMLPGLKQLAPVIAQLMTAFGAELPGLGAAFGHMFAVFAEHGPAMIRSFQLLMHNIDAIVRGVGDLLGVLMEIFGWMDRLHEKAQKGGWDNPFTAMATGAKNAWEWLGKLFDNIGHWFAEMGRGIADWAVNSWNAVKKWVSDTVTAIGNWFESVGKWFSELPGKIGRWLDALPGVIKKKIGEAFDAFFFLLGFVGTKIAMFNAALPGLLSHAAAALRKWALDMGLSAIAWVERMRTEIPLKLAELLVNVSNWANGVYHEFLDWTAKTLVAVATWGNNIKDEFINWISRTIVSVGNWLNELPIRATVALTSLKNNIVKWAGEAGDWLIEMGKNLLNGLVKGVTDKIDWAVDLVKRAMEKIKEGARKALGISSPSKVFAEMGNYSMQGFIQGLTGGRSDLANAWRQLVPNTTATVALAAAGGGASGAGVSGGAGGPTMVATTVQIDGHTIVKAITPAAQRIKTRTGSTGLV